MKRRVLFLIIAFAAIALSALDTAWIAAGDARFPGQEPQNEGSFPGSRSSWQRTQSTRYHFYNGWQPYTLEHFGYNTQGQVDLIGRHLSFEGVWELRYTRDYVYNAQGQLLETVYYDINDGVWSNLHKESNTYDSAGNLDQVMVYEGSGNSWYLSWQQVNSYEQGRLANEHLYSYDSLEGTFTDYEIRDYIYNASGQLVEKNIVAASGEPGYTNQYRILYSYNADGSLALEHYQGWGWMGTHYEWYDQFRNVHSYDANGYLTGIMEQAPSDSLGWHDSKCYTYTNDAYGNPTLVLYQIHFAEGWQDSYKWENVYSNTASADEYAPAAISRLECRPNPFSGSAEISFLMKESAPSVLAVYNLKGQRVRTLASGVRSAGAYSFAWNGKDAADRDLPTGIYLLRLSVPGQDSIVKRVTRY